MTATDQQYLASAKEAKKENELWLRSIRNINPETVYPIIKDTHEEVFAKTNCLTCANCCKTAPPLLTEEDIHRISKALGLSAKQFSKTYILQDFNGDKTFNIVPCRFLMDNNACSIYDIRPNSCRRYPHTDEKEYPKRTQLNVANTLICPAAYQILEKLRTKIPLS